jgi:hypothetical protein
MSGWLVKQGASHPSHNRQPMNVATIAAAAK